MRSSNTAVLLLAVVCLQQTARSFSVNRLRSIAQPPLVVLERVDKNGEYLSHHAGFNQRLRSSIKLASTPLSDSGDSSKSKTEGKKNALQSKTSRILKLVAFSAVVARAFTIETLINPALFNDCFLACGVATAIALRGIEDCYSYGYCLSMIAIGGMTLGSFFGNIFATAASATSSIATSASSTTAAGRSAFSFSLAYPNNPKAWVVFTAVVLHALAHIMYGIRLIRYVHRRRNSTSSKLAPRMQDLQTRSREAPLSRRISVWLSTGILLGGLYALPLHLHTNIASAFLTSDTVTNPVIEAMKSALNPVKIPIWTSIVSCAAGVTALAAVVVQGVADNQKLAHKEKYYKQKRRELQAGAEATAAAIKAGNSGPMVLPFCTTGLYSKWRHPNYAAEFVFQTSNFVAALPAIVISPGSALLAFVGPAVFASIIRAATTRLEQRQWETYGEVEGVAAGAGGAALAVKSSEEQQRIRESYREWFGNTKRFLF